MCGEFNAFIKAKAELNEDPEARDDKIKGSVIILDFIFLIHTFVNIPALIRKRSVFLSSRAGIFTKV